MGWDTTPRCRLCGTTENLQYCDMCKYYFCDDCRKKYPERVMAMMKEKSQNAFDWLQNALGFH
jgi:hypothetical protein